MLDAAVHSEAEGYDAVVMDTTSDSAIYALRSRLSIPVVGGSMASYALANLLGLRMGIVCYLDSQRRWYESKLDFYKCRGQVRVDPRARLSHRTTSTCTQTTARRPSSG